MFCKCNWAPVCEDLQTAVESAKRAETVRHHRAEGIRRNRVSPAMAACDACLSKPGSSAPWFPTNVAISLPTNLVATACRAEGASMRTAFLSQV